MPTTKEKVKTPLETAVEMRESGGEVKNRWLDVAYL